MPIKVGDSLPADLKLKEMGDGGPKDVTVSELFKGRRVVLFAVPGAFTPTCSMKHLPGFVEKADTIRGKKVDEIVCLSVNDAFVMGAWGEASGARGKVRMVADGNGDFTRALGLELDASGFGRTLPKLLQLETPSAFPVRNAVFTHVADHAPAGSFDRNKIQVIVHPHHRDVWYWLIPLSDARCSLGCAARSEFFDDQRSARPRVPGTVARGHLPGDPALETGKVGTGFVTAVPVAIDMKLLKRGQDRYRIYCTPCHGQVGRGDGMIVRRGFRQALCGTHDAMAPLQLHHAAHHAGHLLGIAQRLPDTPMMHREGQKLRAGSLLQTPRAPIAEGLPAEREVRAHGLLNPRASQSERTARQHGGLPVLDREGYSIHIRLFRPGRVSRASGSSLTA